MKVVEPQLTADTLVENRSRLDIEAVIEQIWNDLNGTKSRSEIRKVITEVVPAYEGARIKTYVPIFLRRDVIRRLESGITHIQRTTARELEGRNMKGNS